MLPRSPPSVLLLALCTARAIRVTARLMGFTRIHFCVRLVLTLVISLVTDTAPVSTLVCTLGLDTAVARKNIQSGATPCNLSPLSPTREFDTSFYPSPLLAQSNHKRSGYKLSHCWHCSSLVGPGVPTVATFLHGSKGPRPWLFFFMGTWLPSLAVFLSPRPFGTRFIKPSAHALADSSSVCLAPAPSTRGRMLLLHCCEPSVLTPTAVFDGLLLDTVLMTPRATSPPHRRHGLLPASPPASLHASPRSSSLAPRNSVLLAEHTTASPAFACCASRVVRCVRHQPSLSPLRNRGTLHVLPRATPPLQVPCVVCSPLSSLSWSAGPPARLSELTLLDTHLHVLRADCWPSAALTSSASCAWRSLTTCHQPSHNKLNHQQVPALAVSED